jgi:hypothetical protein
MERTRVRDEETPFELVPRRFYGAERHVVFAQRQWGFVLSRFKEEGRLGGDGRPQFELESPLFSLELQRFVVDSGSSSHFLHRDGIEETLEVDSEAAAVFARTPFPLESTPFAWELWRGAFSQVVFPFAT